MPGPAFSDAGVGKILSSFQVGVMGLMALKGFPGAARHGMVAPIMEEEEEP